MEKIWEIYPRLTAIVRRAHEENDMDKGSGHPFDHVVQVGQCALVISEDPYIGRLAGAAGLTHNADRIIQKQQGKGDKFKVPKEETTTLLRCQYNESGEFRTEEIERNIDAVLQHQNVNMPDSDAVLVALQDADRCTLCMADQIIYTAHFWNELPAIDPPFLLGGRPGTHSYRNPASVLHNVQCRYDWADPNSKVCVRLPKAKAIVESRIEFILAYVAEIACQREELGLWPNYPFADSEKAAS